MTAVSEAGYRNATGIQKTCFIYFEYSFMKEYWALFCNWPFIATPQ